MLKSKKGFSLVELIVVIAIMAVLVGVLAPTLIGYVEKSRAQRDASNLEELRHQVELAIADEEVYQELVFTDNKVELAFTKKEGTKELDISAPFGEGKVCAACTNFKSALLGKVGDTINLTSKKYGNSETVYTITIEYFTDTQNVKVLDNIKDFDA